MPRSTRRIVHSPAARIGAVQQHFRFRFLHDPGLPRHPGSRHPPTHRSDRGVRHAGPLSRRRRRDEGALQQLHDVAKLRRGRAIRSARPRRQDAVPVRPELQRQHRQPLHRVDLHLHEGRAAGARRSAQDEQSAQTIPFRRRGGSRGVRQLQLLSEVGRGQRWNKAIFCAEVGGNNGGNGWVILSLIKLCLSIGSHHNWRFTKRISSTAVYDEDDCTHI